MVKRIHSRGAIPPLGGGGVGVQEGGQERRGVGNKVLGGLH